MTEWGEIALLVLSSYAAGAGHALVKCRDKDQAKADERHNALVTRLYDIDRKVEWLCDQTKIRIR